MWIAYRQESGSLWREVLVWLGFGAQWSASDHCDVTPRDANHILLFVCYGLWSRECHVHLAFRCSCSDHPCILWQFFSDMELFARSWERGCRGSRFNVLEKAERGVDLRKLLVLLPMWIFFLLGTIFGAFAERLLDKDALFIPAFATTFLGVVYMTLRQVLSDLFQRLEKQSLRERLREVHCAFARAGTRIAEGESDELDEIDEEIGEIMLTLGEVETTAGNTQVN